MNLTDLSAWCRQLVAVFPDAVPATRSELERLYEPKAFEDPSEFDCIRALRVAIWGMDHRTEFQSEAQKAWLYETVEPIERYYELTRENETARPRPSRSRGRRSARIRGAA